MSRISASREAPHAMGIDARVSCKPTFHSQDITISIRYPDRTRNPKDEANVAVDPPEGAVTLLFTDIEGSTRRWEALPQAMASALQTHDTILRGTIERHSGYVFKTIGDAFCAVFGDPLDALNATLDTQRALAGQPWGEVGHVRVRMALHSGTPEHRDRDYFGPPVNRVARLLATGAGGQVLVSDATASLIAGHLPTGTTLVDLGAHRLKDLLQPQRIYQVTAPGLETDFPPIKSLDRQPHNLPAQATPLVGREAEIDRIRTVVEDRTVRLTTLTGPGGTGKTRLGLQVAADLVETFPDGAWFVDLAPLPSAELVVQAIAQPLGVRESGHEPLETSVIDYLREKRLLLVLDNCEHVLDAAPLIGRILSTCEGVSALATSRAALRVYGEREVAIPPLALPDPKRLPPLDELAKYESVELFVERAMAIRPGFEITVENAAAIAGICVRLEGLPLAIELAAARVRILPPDRLLERLTDRLSLLTGGASDRDPRQQTLRGAIAWSHDLLSEPERVLFRRLAVFAGGSTFETAEAVTGADGAVDVVDGLESLVAKSLLRQENGIEPRFRMLETIREFATEQLDLSGEAETVRSSYAAQFLALAEEAEPNLTGPDQGRWLDTLETEHDNFRATLTWLDTTDDPRQVPLVALLSRFWRVRGHLTEGRGYLDRAVADLVTNDSAAVPSALVALDAAGVFAEIQGDLDRAAELHERGLVLAQQLGDELAAAKSMSNLGIVFEIRGDFDRATTYYEGASDRFELLGDKAGVAVTLGNLCTVARQQDRLDHAEDLATRCLGIYRELGDEHAVGLVLLNLGMLAYKRRDYLEASELYESALENARSIGDRSSEAYALVDLGLALGRLGDGRQALALMDEALPIFEELKDKVGLAFALFHNGMAQHAAGRSDHARKLLMRSVEFRQQLDESYGVAQCLEGLGAVVVADGLVSEGVMLFAVADALRSASGTSLAGAELDDHEIELQRARSQMDAATFDGAWSIGALLTPAQVLAEFT
jgi:predicted ATPase/class 3 adenylate cyclase